MARRNNDDLVLVSWIAVANDPYRRRDDGSLDVDKWGPTLSLLFDEASPYCGKVTDFVLFYRNAPGDPHKWELSAVRDTKLEIEQRTRGQRPITIHEQVWRGTDPTDHRAIFEFLKEQLARVRETFKDRKLIVHISPGTPSMQTVWVLMGETGYIKEPFELVKSYRKEHRRGRPAVVPVKVGVETFYKHFLVSRPGLHASDDQRIRWDPSEFRSQRMRSLFEEARRFAVLNVPILILGERGTGKTTLANWIRAHSPFRKDALDRRWPAVPCGQYNPETMRAELFGYVKGAFTGATRDKPGLLATANGDTLFLDEIGDLKPDLQRLMIKAVEEHTYHRLGSDELMTSRFRLLSATNIDFETLRKRLDPDFLDRVAPLKLHIPPLREVPEELDWLWQQVYLEACERAGSSQAENIPPSVHHDVVETLKQHPLKGNLRDLFRVAYRIVAARSDPASPLPTKELAAYGLLALDDPTPMSRERALARAVADRAPLGPLVAQHGKLELRAFLKNVQGYLADQLFRLHAETDTAFDTLCDVPERTLRSWRSPKN